MGQRRAADEADDIDAWNTEDASELERPSDLRKYEIVVASRDWTVETIVRQVAQGNIDLDPAFQRRNAWRDSRRSRLIESFVMGFPVPQIVLAENPRKRGTFVVIDGKQRLLTITGFFLDAYRDYWNQPKIVGLNVLKDLNRVTIDEFLKDPEFRAFKRQLENADIRTTVITGFKDERVLYDIFYRINTGSVPLSSQELRQALNGGPFAAYLLEITTEENPLWKVLDLEAPDPRLRDVELLLRLVAWRRHSREYRGNMKPFLDDAMSKLNAAWVGERKSTEKLVDQILRGIDAASRIFGENAGRKFKDGSYESSVNRALFEVQAYYFSFPDVRAAALKNLKAVNAAFKQLSNDADFVASIESTTKSIENYRTRFTKYRAAIERAVSLDLEPLVLGAQNR